MIEVFALDFLCVLLADLMLLGIEMESMEMLGEIKKLA
jgi:hypothetical protein